MRIFDSTKLQEKPTHPWHIEASKDFPQNEQSITLSPLQTKIYDFLYTHKLTLNHIYGVLLSLFVLLTSLVLWRFKPKMRSSLLVFSFSASFAGFFSALFIVALPRNRDALYVACAAAWDYCLCGAYSVVALYQKYLSSP